MNKRRSIDETRDKQSTDRIKTNKIKKKTEVEANVDIRLCLRLYSTMKERNE